MDFKKIDAKKVKAMSIEQMDAEIKKVKDFLRKNPTGEEAFHATHALKRLTTAVVKKRTEQLALLQAELKGVKAAQAVARKVQDKLKR